MGDVRGVVAAVPCVEESGALDGQGTAFGVGKGAVPVGFGERLEEHDPAGVKSFDEFEGPLDGSGGGVVEVGPGVFIVRLDGGRIFCEREADSGDCIHVRIGDVVDELADRPSAVAVWGVELAWCKGVDGLAKVAGKVGKVGDGCKADILGDLGRRMKVANRVALVGVAVGG